MVDYDKSMDKIIEKVVKQILDIFNLDNQDDYKMKLISKFYYYIIIIKFNELTSMGFEPMKHYCSGTNKFHSL